MLFLPEHILQKNVDIKEHDLKWMKLKQIQHLVAQHLSPDLQQNR